MKIEMDEEARWLRQPDEPDASEDGMTLSPVVRLQGGTTVRRYELSTLINGNSDTIRVALHARMS